MISKLALAAVVTLTLASCTRDNVTYTESTAAYRVSFGAGLYTYVNVWTDPETGCQSYVTDDGFMSPRLTADGMQRCEVAALIVPAPKDQTDTSEQAG